MLYKDFVPYEQALELKELGFDEPCLAHLIGFGDGTIENGKYFINYQQVFYPNDFIESDDKAEELGLHPFGICGVPLYQQAFRWFREKYGLFYYITTHDSTDFEWYVYDKDQNEWEDDTTQNTYEEAELACLIKLIEIANEQQ